jgi:hypothetical protein
MVLRLRTPAPGNWAYAKCLGVCATDSYDPFFEDMDEALDYCNGLSDGRPCPIREECLLFALTNNLKEGIWGGCSELTRRALRRRWPLQGREPRPEWHWMTEEHALEGVSLVDLLAENAETDEEDEDGY